MVQPLWKTVWSFLIKLKSKATIWFNNPTPGHISRQNYNSKRYTHPYVHNGTIHNSQDMKLTWIHVHKRMNKEDMIPRQWNIQFSSVHSVMSDSLWPMDYSKLGFPVHQQFPAVIQTHVHQVSEAIQSSHPLSSPSPPDFSLSQHQGLFQWVSSLHHVAKVLSFSFSSSPSNEYSGLISLGLMVGFPCIPRDSQESSPTPQLKSISSLVLRSLYSPTLKIHTWPLEKV